MTRIGGRFMLAVALFAGMVFGQQAGVSEWIAKITWAKPAEGKAVVEKILRGGSPAVGELCSMIKAPGKGDNALPRFALQGVVIEVMQGGDEARRAMVSGQLLKALAAAKENEVKAFLIRQLQLVAKDEAVSALAALLSSDRLSDPAAQALVAIGTQTAAAALRGALPTAKPTLRVTLIRALGDLRDAKSASIVLPFASDPDLQTRLAAWYALANSGVKAADSALVKGSGAADLFEKSRALRARMLLAQRLSEGGDKQSPAAIARELLTIPVTPGTRNVICGALATLVDVEGAKALPQLLQAAKSPDWQIREAALKLAEALPETHAEFAALGAAAESPALRASTVAMLGRSGNAAMFPVVSAAVKDKEAIVRAAAVNALTRFGDQAAAPLVKVIATATGADVTVAKTALLRVRTPQLGKMLAAALPSATPDGKVAILEILAARGFVPQADAALAETTSKNRTIVKAALKSLETIARTPQLARVLEFFLTTSSSSARSGARRVLVAICQRQAEDAQTVLIAQGKATGKQRAELLGVLARIGGTPCLQAVLKDYAATDETLKDSALRALKDWKDADAAPALLDIVKTTKNKTHRVLAFRGYVRVAGLAGGRTIPMLRHAGEFAQGAADKRLVLGQLGAVRSEAALAEVAKYLDDKDVVEEAAAAAVKIACPRNSRDKGLISTKIARVMNKVVAVAKNKATLGKANAHLPNLPISIDGVNIAVGKPVQTSCAQQGDKAPWKAVDGKDGKLDAWFGAAWPSWYQVDLKKTTEISAARVIYYYDGRRYYTYTIDVSTDGKTWQKVADNSANKTPATRVGMVHKFTKPVKARYVRLNIAKNSVNEAVHLVEFEIYSADSNAERLSVKQINDPNNLALGKLVTTSIAQEQDKAPEGAVNGVLANGDGWWGGPSKEPVWIQVDLGAPASVDTVRVVCYNADTRSYSYLLEGSVDGKVWTLLADHSKNKLSATAQGYVHRFKAASLRYVRLDNLKNSSNPSVHVNEIEIYAAGKAPKTFAVAGAPARPAPAAVVKAPPLPPADKDGFIPLFNGKDLTGWMGSTSGYGVEDGIMFCRKKGGGRLLTMHRFSDFILHFDVKIPLGANNGLAVRVPLKGNAAYAGMELQIIDNKGYEKAHKYKLKPWQTHGSIYGCVPAKVGAQKPAGEWNHQEVRAIGSRITVLLNGQTIVDADVDALTETADGKGLGAHTGLQRRTGHLGWLGHGARVEFKNIRIKPLPPYTQGPHNVPPKGFTALFNGKDLAGWKGLVANPEKRAKMTPGQLAATQKKADEQMRAHWKIEEGTLVYDGKGQSLCTAKDYGDFEMLVDWKIKKGGDSGIYLRGSPQVQIWDTASHPEGSAGLYNNQRNPRKPTECADNAIGEWSRFHIKMVGEKVSVRLNGVLVVDNVIMENYWNRKIPIYPTGQIELQHHGNTLWFRNVFIR